MNKLRDMTPEVLAAHLSTALSTESGQVLREWLAVQCCMRGITPEAQAETAISLAMRNAVRDLYINLESVIREKRHNIKTAPFPGL